MEYERHDDDSEEGAYVYHGPSTIEEASAGGDSACTSTAIGVGIGL